MAALFWSALARSRDKGYLVSAEPMLGPSPVNETLTTKISHFWGSSFSHRDQKHNIIPELLPSNNSSGVTCYNLSHNMFYVIQVCWCLISFFYSTLWIEKLKTANAEFVLRVYYFQNYLLGSVPY